jgi:tetratricopeptide (TPR) repeat protein
MLRLMSAGLASLFLVLHASGQVGRGRARLTGLVIDDAGNPVVSAKIVLLLLETVAGSNGRIDNTLERVSFDTATDNKGKWSISGLGSGIWEVEATAGGYVPAWRKCSVYQLQANPVVRLTLVKLPTFEVEKAQSLTESALLEKASEFFYLRKFDEAIALCEHYLRAHPDDHMVALSVGNCLAEKGDIDAAIARYELVLEKTSRDPMEAFAAAKAYGCIGECYWMKKDAGKAEEFFRRALGKGAENEQWAFNTAEIRFSRGATDDAIAYYRKASELAPGWSDPEYKLGLAFLKKGDQPSARGHFEKFLRLEPGTARSAEVKKTLADIK